jgi:hypothetical protein
MYSDSRKAQRNSFAHHRAQLLFKRHDAQAGDARDWAATVHEGTDPADRLLSLTRQVRAGLLGFVPANAVAASI